MLTRFADVHVASDGTQDPSRRRQRGIRQLFRQVTVSICVVLLTSIAGAFSATASFAQSPPRLSPPAPIGSPNVPAGPTPNPFGPPPLAIGPAPFSPPVDQNRYVVPYRFSVPDYSVRPYSVRRPSPFDPNAPVAAPPNPGGTENPTAASITPSPVDAPSAVGNLRLTVTENFLNRIVARDETRPGEVRDFILGAQVSGWQTTITHLRLDLLPGVDKARGMLVLKGKTHSETTGVTPQAMVDVASQQDFVATKEIFFDGMIFSTRHAVVHIRANNQTVGATTPLTGTVLGGLADRIAFRQAERRKFESEAIARDKVADRVYPEFDNSIDKQLALANDQLDGVVRRQLKASNLLPTVQHVSSTDTVLNYSAQVVTEDAPTTAPPDDHRLELNGVYLSIHESLLNGLVSRAGLRGLKTTDKQAKEFLAPYEIKSDDDGKDGNLPSIALPGMENIVTEIEFDKTDPLTIRIERDKVLATIRAKFRPAGQDILPALSMTIAYRMELSGDKVIVTAGDVQVVPLDDTDAGAGGGIAMKLLSQAVEANLSKLAFDRTLPASYWPGGGQIPRINAIRSADGWAIISID